jgi:O-acetyl-ADP-ribose deacetylase (regulator of RNase III)
MAFPAISTGIYGFPKRQAAQIAVKEAQRFRGDIEVLMFVCFDEETTEFYRDLLSA